MRKEDIATLKVGTNIKRLREIKGIKQEVLAKQLDLTSVSLSNIENDKVDITISRLPQIAEVLHSTQLI
jgi:transcriptional regulator with XRE-family HTH domain